jgi:hypothetical protein
LAGKGENIMAVLGTFTSGSVLTAAELNAIGTWTSFTPSFTGVTLGSGALNTGQFCRVNKLLFIRTKTVLGTGGSFSNPILTVPNSGVMTGSPTMLWIPSMQGVMIDAGVNSYAISVIHNSTTSLGFYAQTASGTYVTWTSAVSATVPFTSGVNDYLELTGFVQVD